MSSVGFFFIFHLFLFPWSIYRLPRLTILCFWKHSHRYLNNITSQSSHTTHDSLSPSHLQQHLVSLTHAHPWRVIDISTRPEQQRFNTIQYHHLSPSSTTISQPSTLQNLTMADISFDYFDHPQNKQVCFVGPFYPTAL